MSIRFRALLYFALAAPSLAQTKVSAGTKPAAKTAATAAVPKANPGLTTDGVIAMAEAGIPDDLIVAKLRKENKSFDLAPDEMIRLKRAKVSDVVLRVMLDPQAEIKPAAVAAAPPAATVAIQPVVIAAPGMAALSGVGAARASGATPAAGAEARGDPNDPLVPHDSGIYVMTKDREGKPAMIVLERASYQGSKSGGYLASAMTYGIMKAKSKAIIPGARASIRVSETSPVFYFYFEDKQAGLGKSYFGVGNLSNPNQFALLKLEINKNNRESTVGQFSALGASSGNDSRAMIPFKSERVRPGLYKVTVEDMKPGEYCFVATSNAGVQSPYGATASVTSDIFDFGVSVE